MLPRSILLEAHMSVAVAIFASTSAMRESVERTASAASCMWRMSVNVLTYLHREAFPAPQV